MVVPSWYVLSVQVHYYLSRRSAMSLTTTIIPGDPGCQLYLGVNRTRAESVIGHLKPGFQNEIQIHLPMNESFTIGNSGFECMRFSVYIYVPQGQPEPPPSELRVTTPESWRSTIPRQWTIPLELTSKVISTFLSFYILNTILFLYLYLTHIHIISGFFLLVQFWPCQSSRACLSVLQSSRLWSLCLFKHWLA